MKAESTKKFKHGFILYEAKFRRIVDLAKEQVLKEIAKDEVSSKYEIKYKNGTIAETQFLDEVLEQENFASSGIVSLKTNISATKPDNNLVSVSFSFGNPNFTESESSVSYIIKGISKDWVFVTAALLEERVQDVKRAKIFTFQPELFLYFIAFIFISTLFIGGRVFLQSPGPSTPDIVVSILPDLNQEEIKYEEIVYSKELRKAYEENTIANPIEAIIFLEELKERREKSRNEYIHDLSVKQAEELGELKSLQENLIWYDTKSFQFIMLIIVIPFLIVFALYLLTRFVNRYYPPFNFCWGEYLVKFEHIENERRFILGVVVVGMVVSVIGGIIANFIGS